MDERLRRELQEQASRNARELADARAASLREQEAAVAAAVTAKALQLKAVKAVEDKAHAALAARLEVRAWHEKERDCQFFLLLLRVLRSWAALVSRHGSNGNIRVTSHWDGCAPPAHPDAARLVLLRRRCQLLLCSECQPSTSRKGDDGPRVSLVSSVVSLHGCGALHISSRMPRFSGLLLC